MNDKVTDLAKILLDVIPKLAVFAGTPWLKVAYYVAEGFIEVPEVFQFFHDNKGDQDKTLAKMEQYILLAMKVHEPSLLEDNQLQPSGS
jgi:hypothetical protein